MPVTKRERQRMRHHARCARSPKHRRIMHNVRQRIRAQFRAHRKARLRATWCRRNTRTVGASMFGIGDGESHGYRGDRLAGTMSYAELGYSGGPASTANNLGGLPYRHPLKITYRGRSVVAIKLDIGAGGGPVAGFRRDIDLWRDAAAAIGFPFGLGLVQVAPARC